MYGAYLYGAYLYVAWMDFNQNNFWGVFTALVVEICCTVSWDLLHNKKQYDINIIIPQTTHPTHY